MASIHYNILKMLELREIYAGYDRREILHGVSVSFGEGKIYALLGPNGAGKTTLLKTIIGLVTPWKGQVIYRGEDITPLPPYKRVEKGIAYFMQGGQVFPSLTVRENLEIGAIGLKPQEVEARRKEISQIFPMLDELLPRRAGLLSGGQRQQLALAMVLFKRPKVLLLDEPSAGLAPDLLPQIEKQVSLIKEIFCTTIILVEQNTNLALKLSDEVLLMEEGRMKNMKGENEHSAIQRNCGV